MVTRGEVWLVTLDPSVGSEIHKTRPCVIVSPAEMHDYLRTVIVAPMTTGARPAPRLSIAVHNHARLEETAGGWKGLVDTDELKRRIEEDSPSRNPAVGDPYLSTAAKPACSK